MTFRSLICVLIYLAAPSAMAGAAEVCGQPIFEGSADYATALVKAPGKTRFSDDAGKPASAYLLPGDEVVVMDSVGPKSCVAYESTKLEMTTGWIPTASLGPMAKPVVRPAGWRGTFIADSFGTQIRLKPLANGHISADGEAYWAMSAQAAENGALHDGSMSGEGALKDGALHIDSSSDGAPCRVDIRRLGRTYLVAKDNIVEQDGGPACGGANVTFTGLYVLKAK